MKMVKLRYQGKLVVLNKPNLKSHIFEEAYISWYMMYPKSTKMYRVLKTFLAKWHERVYC